MLCLVLITAVCLLISKNEAEKHFLYHFEMLVIKKLHLSYCKMLDGNVCWAYQFCNHGRHKHHGSIFHRCLFRVVGIFLNHSYIGMCPIQNMNHFLLFLPSSLWMQNCWLTGRVKESNARQIVSNQRKGIKRANFGLSSLSLE